MRCSFIVSAFDRPHHLSCVLRSLQVQTEREFEVIITDNSKEQVNFETVFSIADNRFVYLSTQSTDCYASANRGAAQAKGDYLSFPSDDGYYVPRFLETMLQAAPADLIYCDCVYDGYGKKYEFWDAEPKLGLIDKGGFLVKREVFPGFNGAPEGPCAADGWMIEQAVKYGATTAKVPGILWIHN